jgi:hypothetical protein
MKKIKEMRFALVILALIFSINLSAQESSKDVTITASGSGATLEDAKQSALRSATEQAFGAFISSKTEVFNDQVVADQMSSVSSGNIKSYEVLNEDQLPDGRWGTTIRAIVSVDRLTSFVQAKGIEVEVKGGLFALNIKQQMLNEEGEIQAIYLMFGILHETMQTAFDYTIKSGDPKSLDDENLNWEIPLEVTATCNKNMDFCANYFIKTLKALSLTNDEVAGYKLLNKQVFKVRAQFGDFDSTFVLRKKMSINIINSFGSNWEYYVRLFTVDSGINEILGETSNTWAGSLKGFSLSNYFSSIGVVVFPRSGEVPGKLSWKDSKSLKQIEEITSYSVKPRGVVLPFKYGGYVVHEEGGHGLVISICDVSTSSSWDNATSFCSDLVLSGFNDWRLPTIQEAKVISNKLLPIRVGYFAPHTRKYWTSSVGSEWDYGADYRFYMDFGLDSHTRGSSYASLPDRLHEVRAVRTY